jgi:plastocyanin
MTRKRAIGDGRIRALGLAAAALLSAGCGDSPGDVNGDVRKAIATAMRSSGADDVKIAITADGYEPSLVRVPAGGKVTWVNVGGPPTTAENYESGRLKIDTHTIYRGQSKSWVFKIPGRYDYFSVYDSQSYSGTVIVERSRGATP